MMFIISYRYLDRYKDVKQINEEVLREKLKTINPFQPKPPQPKYPNVALVDKSTPSWLKLKNKHRRLQYISALRDVIINMYMPFLTNEMGFTHERHPEV